MNWLILAGLAGLASNGFNITNRTALKNKGDSTAYAWWFEFIRSLFFLIILISMPLESINIQTFLILSLVSLTELFSVYFFMRMHALSELSISSIISRLRVVWSPIVAWLLLGERLTLTQYFGISAIFLGIAVVTSLKGIRKDTGIKIALIFSFTSAVLSTVLKIAGNFASTEMIIFSQGIIPLIILPFIMKQGVMRIIESGKNKIMHNLTAGTFNIISSYLLVEALHKSDASKVIGIYQAMTVFSVIYGIFILKETDKMYLKLLGVIIVVIGVVLTVI